MVQTINTKVQKKKTPVKKVNGGLSGKIEKKAGKTASPYETAEDVAKLLLKRLSRVLGISSHTPVWVNHACHHARLDANGHLLVAWLYEGDHSEHEHIPIHLLGKTYYWFHSLNYISIISGDFATHLLTAHHIRCPNSHRRSAVA